MAKAIADAGSREEVVRLKYGGITVPNAVDTSPQRRVDTALMFIARQCGYSGCKSVCFSGSCQEVIE